jgi:hypothetical protein
MCVWKFKWMPCHGEGERRMTREEEAIEVLKANYPSKCFEQLREAVDMAIKALEKDPKWIPVSKRLPEEREWIGTKQFGTTISDEVYVTLETPDGERFTRHLFFQNGGLSQNDKDHMRVWYKGAVPIAWMPLPSPFEPQESEEV